MDKPKRLKEQLDEFDAANKKVRFTFGTLVVTGWCVFLIIIATFTQIDFSRRFRYTFGKLQRRDAEAHRPNRRPASDAASGSTPASGTGRRRS